MLARFDGKKFKKIRKQKRRSQAWLAERADTSIRYIRDLEKGIKSNPSAAMVYSFSSALEVPMEMLMTVVEDELVI